MSAVNRVLPWLLLLKAIDVMGSSIVLFDSQLLAGALTAALVVAALVWLRAPRQGAAIAAVVLLVMAVGPLYRNHVAFLAWIAVLTALARDEPEHRLLLTVHLSVVYAFATMAKLNPEWLSGEALAARSAVDLGVPWPLLAWLTVVVEGVLAVAVWRPNRGWLAVALPIHVAFVIGMGGDWLTVLRLTVFNAAILTVWFALVRMRELSPGAPVLQPLKGVRVRVG